MGKNAPESHLRGNPVIAMYRPIAHRSFLSPTFHVSQGSSKCGEQTQKGTWCLKRQSMLIETRLWLAQMGAMQLNLYQKFSRSTRLLQTTGKWALKVQLQLIFALSLALDVKMFLFIHLWRQASKQRCKQARSDTLNISAGQRTA